MRILMYSGPVLALSVLLNIPKFYEIDVSRIVSMGGGNGQELKNKITRSAQKSRFI